MKKFDRSNTKQSNRRDSRGSGRRDSRESDREYSRGRDSRGSGREYSRGRDSRGSGREYSRGRDSRGSGRGYSGGRNFGRSRRSSEPPTMHKTVCDECKQDCEVPFKPTANKPIYCDECFKKKGGSGNKSEKYEKDLAEINEKLDKIVELLESK